MKSDPFQKARQHIESGWKTGRLAHAYLLQGAPYGAAGRFADDLLDLIFDSHPGVRTGAHPDIARLEPQSKSRRITIDDVRDRIIRPLSQTASAGGWKAGVLISADRMTDQAANALLKTLEEPPAHSLLLLLTDNPQALPTTVVSRCQRIVLTAADDAVARHWTPPLLDLLAECPPANVPQAGLFTARIVALLAALKKEFEKEEADRLPEEMDTKEAKKLQDARAAARLIEARADLLRTLLLWQRDILNRVLGLPPETLHHADHHEAIDRQAARCSRTDALQRIAAVETMRSRLDRNLPHALVFGEFFAQIAG